LIEKLRTLPPEGQQEVLVFIEYIQGKLLMQQADDLAQQGDTNQALLRWQEALMKLPVDSLEYKGVLSSLKQTVPDSFLVGRHVVHGG
jgi:hypothetical protein